MTIIKAIVTGHTHGLGAAIAAELRRRHIAVLGIARGSTGAADVQQVQLDLSAAAAVQAWLAGPPLADFLADADVAVLINNAGVVQPVGALADQDVGEVAAAVALNVAAPLMLSAALARIMAGRQCRILHVSSGAGSNAYPGWSVYGATKAALDHHARAVALDATPGLRICSLAPGVIDTAMQAQIRATPLARFPLRARFESLKADGALAAPADSAQALVRYALAERFGERPVDDVRQA